MVHALPRCKFPVLGVSSGNQNTSHEPSFGFKIVENKSDSPRDLFD